MIFPCLPNLHGWPKFLEFASVADLRRNDSWWLPQLSELVQQGDVLSVLPWSRALVPFQPLKKTTLKKGQTAWLQISDSNEPGEHHALAKGRRLHAVILSHDCELDKNRSRGRVHLAPVVPLSGLREEERQITLSQKTYKNLPLPKIVPLNGEDYYADLLSMQAVDAKILESAQRLASMTDAARNRSGVRLSFDARRASRSA